MNLDPAFKDWLLRSDPKRPDLGGVEREAREQLVARLEATELETLCAGCQDQLKALSGALSAPDAPPVETPADAPVADMPLGVTVGGKPYEIRRAADGAQVTYQMLSERAQLVAAATFVGAKITRLEFLRDAPEIRSAFLTTIRTLGGAGSGNFGHKGRPGAVGGSGEGGGSSEVMRVGSDEDYHVEVDGQRMGFVRKYILTPPPEMAAKGFTPQVKWETGVDPSRAKDQFDRSVMERPSFKTKEEAESWLLKRVAPKTLGGAGSGNFGHKGRPGEIGGSSSEGGAAPWKSSGGWEHTGITWKQPTDPTTGRPIPIKVATVEDAVAQVLDGKVVEVADPRTAYVVIERLAAMAAEAKAKGEDAPTYDLCQVSVAGTNMFCAESLRTPEYPEGVPRLEMPQLGGHPEPGSEADKLPKDTDGKVDGSQQFITYLQGLGVKTRNDEVPATALRASQREIVGAKVGGMMAAKTYDPGKKPIFVSKDHYVVDGHHRWAAVVGRDAEDNKLGDSKMKIIEVNAPISEVLHLANAWSAKFGIKQAAGVVRQQRRMGLE